MSAIWGCVDFSQSLLPESLIFEMQKPLLEYKIDRYNFVKGQNIVMGCGIQYITAESINETMPIYDKNSEIYFTADCLIYNREDLISELCSGRQDIPDGELLFLAYSKWSEQTAKHVFGSYAYAAYEAREKRLVICSDHTFSRSIYYSHMGSRVYFSTIIESILCGKGEKPTVNELWLMLYLAKSDLTIHSNATDTPYEGVFRVQASHSLVFYHDRYRDVEYWSAKNVKRLHLRGDDEYREYFRGLMSLITRQTVRTSGEVGIMLSSGLDSTSVAAFTSRLLESRNKKLYSYTYIPVDRYESTFNKRYILTNEQKGVELLTNMYPSIEPKFLSVPEINAIDATGRLLDILEVPYKSHTNMSWIDKFAHIAAKDGCKILLTGQVGNSTISAGEMLSYIISRITHGRLIDAVKTANVYAKHRGFGRRWFAKRLLKEMIPGFIRKKQAGDYLKYSIVNRGYARSLGVTKQDKRLEGGIGFFHLYTFEKERSLIFNPIDLGQLGEAETKLYMKYGMVTLDITRDIRIFEFCLGAPIECFVSNHIETRRLVRYYLADMIPKALTDEKAPRGRQAADWLERLLPRWDMHYSDLVRGCKLPALQKYLDGKAVEEYLEKLYFNPAAEAFNKLYKVYAAGIFLESHDWK